MELMVVVLAGALAMLIGFVLGTRFAEEDLRMRERRLARQRQELHEARVALRGRAGEAELVRARERARRAASDPAGPAPKATVERGGGDTSGSAGPDVDGPDPGGEETLGRGEPVASGR
jgi:hypothetical protein